MATMMLESQNGESESGPFDEQVTVAMWAVQADLNPPHLVSARSIHADYDLVQPVSPVGKYLFAGISVSVLKWIT